jgi:hypothetical protein
VGDAVTLRFGVHRLSTGQVSAAVVLRTGRGRETLDRRLAPTRPLGTPPPAPPGFHPAQWTILWAAWVTAGQDPDALAVAVRRPRAPGGAAGAHQPNG